MKTALNSDKMMQISDYVIKVDMDNGFCSAINVVDYPGGAVHVLNDNFSHAGMMLFTNDQEPVLEVMDSIYNSAYSFEEYEDDRARKGGQGICFKKGMDAIRRYEPYTNPQGYKIEAQVLYLKNFLHFQLSSRAYVDAPFNAHAGVIGTFEWVGKCNGSGSGNIFWSTESGSNGFSHYSAGSALASAKIKAKASNRAIGETPYAQFGY